MLQKLCLLDTTNKKSNKKKQKHRVKDGVHDALTVGGGAYSTDKYLMTT